MLKGAPRDRVDGGDRLLRAAIAGDKAALELLLLDCHRRLASRIARKLPAAMRGTISSDDVLQETFAEVFRYIGRFEPRGEDAFFYWVAGIADHRLADMIKARCAAKRGGGRSPVHAQGDPAATSVIDLLEMLAAHERTPSRSAVRHEVILAVEGALGALREDYREALQLRYIRGLPVAEIAATMRRTEGAVHMLCNRGLKQLKMALGRSSAYFSRKG